MYPHTTQLSENKESNYEQIKACNELEFAIQKFSKRTGLSQNRPDLPGLLTQVGGELYMLRKHLIGARVVSSQPSAGQTTGA